MKHILRPLLLPCCLALMTGCSNDNDDVEPLPGDNIRRTVLMYVSAQNSLGYNRFIEKDSAEISQGRQFINDNDRLLVYMDDDKAPRIYRYTRDSQHPEVVRQWTTDVNSSSPEVLEDVLTWVRTYYPAQEYGLVMASHSDGWLPSTNKHYERNAPTAGTYSFGIDVGPDGNMKYDQDAYGNTGAQMDITDMAKAIATSGMHLQYIFFDSCLMQSLESGYTLRNVTDYIVAGPIQIPACGANYTHLLQKGLFTQAEYDIVDTYAHDAIGGYDDPQSEYYDYGIVLSSIRTDQLENLARTTAAILPNSAANHRSSVDLDGVPHYQAYTNLYYNRPHNYDAQETMRRLCSEANFARYKKALDRVIVHKGATTEFWIGPGYYSRQQLDLNRYCGVAAFVPQQVYKENAKDCPWGDLNRTFQSTAWYKAAGWAATGW